MTDRQRSDRCLTVYPVFLSLGADAMDLKLAYGLPRLKSFQLQYAKHISAMMITERLGILKSISGETRQKMSESAKRRRAGGGRMKDKLILDATCGYRTILFQKNEPHTIYCDKRREEWEGDFGKTLRADGKKKHRHLVIDPDVQCDFTDLPFRDKSFNLVVFDPPHIPNLSSDAWMRKAYGSLDGDWKMMIRKGFEECMRVLKANGVLIFKWSDVSVSTHEILNTIGQEPLFGHRSGKKMNTHWLCFMKFEEDAPEEDENG